MGNDSKVLTISILRQTRHVFDALELPPHHLLNWFHQRVRHPTSELVERYKFVAFLLLERQERVTGPNVTKRYAPELGACGRPDRGKAVDEDRPECEDVSTRFTAVGNELGLEVVCTQPLATWRHP